VNDRPDSIGKDDPNLGAERLKCDHRQGIHGKRGASLSRSASPRRLLEFPQPMLDMVAYVQGKAADTREKPADPDQYPSK
jgi:hypothetical protein